MSINISTYKTQERTPTKGKERNSDFLKIELSTVFSDKNRVGFYKEFATLLNSGVDFRQALEILQQQQKKEAHKKLIGEITKAVVRGKSLFEALKDSGKFSAYEFYSIKIGEETRKLGEVLADLSEYFDRKVKMKRQIVSVLTYPSFVLVLTFGVLYFMLRFVVPMFSTVFKQFGKELPSLTKKIVFLSENFSVITLGVVGVLIAIIGTHFLLKSREAYQAKLAWFILKIPFMGKLIKKIYITRFCQSLSLLLRAKTPLITSLDLVQKMISFHPLETSLKEVKSDIGKGVLFSTALAKHSIYDFKLLSMVKVAEKINKLDEMFERLAQQYDEETQHQTKMIGVVIEPMIIVIIGGIVGVVLIAMYSPMFDLSKILQN